MKCLRFEQSCIKYPLCTKECDSRNFASFFVGLELCESVWKMNAKTALTTEALIDDSTLKLTSSKFGRDQRRAMVRNLKISRIHPRKLGVGENAIAIRFFPVTKKGEKKGGAFRSDDEVEH